MQRTVAEDIVRIVIGLCVLVRPVSVADEVVPARDLETLAIPSTQLSSGPFQPELQQLEAHTHIRMLVPDAGVHDADFHAFAEDALCVQLVNASGRMRGPVRERERLIAGRRGRDRPE